MLDSLRRRQRFQTFGKSVGVADELDINQPFQIVDSIMALFRADYSGRGELSERQQKARMHVAIFWCETNFRRFISACASKPSSLIALVPTTHAI